MNKKNIIIRILIILILSAMLLPAFAERNENEKINNDVVFALNYNSAYNALSDEEFEQTLKTNKEIGVKAISVAEESLNTLMASGFVLYTNYSDLSLRYDDESESIVKILEGDLKLRKDSYILVAKTPQAKEYLDKWISAKYKEDEFRHFVSSRGNDIYVLYEGGTDGKKIAVGFNEEKIENAKNHGFDISLVMMFGAFSNTEYIDIIGELVDKYDIKYINLKNNASYENSSDYAEDNYEAMCNLIKEKKLYLIVTENQDQLSNQRPIGYDKLVEAADGRVLRSYETVDFKDEDLVSARYHQILNSVVDRNLRFVIINQFTSGIGTYEEKSDKTNEATRIVINKLESIGYNTKEYDTQFDYSVNRKLTSAIAMMLMIIMGITMMEIIFCIKTKKLQIAGIILALLGGGFSLVMPDSLISLYPTLFAMLAPCFAITVVMGYIKTAKEKLSLFALTVTTVIISVLVLSLCGFVQASLLAGLDYYINSLIFRGIKISLILPILYSAVAYGFIFAGEKGNYLQKAVKILNMEIKAYWVILGVGFAGVAAIYLIRSGNVTSISPLEELMRNSIAEVMSARPRTKEFLIGWPSLILFLYYIKNSNITLLKWGFAVGSSILFASVINSFCHVFTSAEIIYTRVFNGVLVGAVVSVFAIIVNAIIVKLVRKVIKEYNKEVGEIN